MQVTNTHLNVQKKKTIIFDFDGTLVDIEPVFIEIFNALAPEFHYEPLLIEDIPQLKNFGAREFIQKRLRVPFWNLWKLERRAKEEYQKQIQNIKLFPEMQYVLEQLKSNGYQVGVLSSNVSTTIQDILNKFNIQVDFIYQSSIFGKARAIKKALRQEHTDIASALYIGDEVRDVEACQKIGIDMLAVSWGLNDKAALDKTGAIVLDHPQEILKKLITVQ